MMEKEPIPPDERPSRRDRPGRTKPLNLDDTPLNILAKALSRWAIHRFGWQFAALVAGVFFLIFFVWYHWSTIAALPGMDLVIATIRETKRMPQARGDRFAIVLPRLENDKDGAHRALLQDALVHRFGKTEIEVLLVEHTIAADGSDKPQAAVSAGH